MAFTFTVAASGGSAVDATVYSTAVTYHAERVYAHYWSACSASADPGGPTLGGGFGGLEVDGFVRPSQAYNTLATPLNRVGSTFLWRVGASASGPPVSFTLTFTFGSTLASFCFAIIEITGIRLPLPDEDNNNTNGADTGAPTVTLPTAFVAPGNACLAAFASDDANGTSAIPDFTPDADFTVLAQPSVSDGTASMRLVVLVRAQEDLTPNGTWSVASTDWGGMAIELALGEEPPPDQHPFAGRRYIIKLAPVRWG